MTTPAIALHAPRAPSLGKEQTLRRLIDEESRRHQIERAFPRLATGVKLWIADDIMPKIGGDRDEHLRRMLRRSFRDHEIYPCDKVVHVASIERRLLKKPVEIVIQWASLDLILDIQDLIERSRHLGDMLALFAQKAEGKVHERSQ